jgi:hypothetical protein
MSLFLLVHCLYLFTLFVGNLTAGIHFHHSPGAKTLSYLYSTVEGKKEGQGYRWREGVWKRRRGRGYRLGVGGGGMG